MCLPMAGGFGTRKAAPFCRARDALLLARALISEFDEKYGRHSAIFLQKKPQDSQDPAASISDFLGPYTDLV
jgi:hypothetical protein